MRILWHALTWTRTHAKVVGMLVLSWPVKADMHLQFCKNWCCLHMFHIQASSFTHPIAHGLVYFVHRMEPMTYKTVH